MPRRRKPAPLGKTTHAIVSADGTTLHETGHGKGSALLICQKLAEQAPGPTRMHVELRTLFGEPVVLYHVTRGEKDVLTHTIEDVD